MGSAADNSVRLPAGTPSHLVVITQEGIGTRSHLTISPPEGGFPNDLKINNASAAFQSIGIDSKLTFGSFTIIVLSRGEQLALRIKDLNAPTRAGFHGLHWYPTQESYRIQAKWIPYSRPRDIRIETIVGTVLQEKIPGRAEFILDDKRLRLEPIVERDKLFFILRDTTSRSTTYQAARFLYTTLPSDGITKPGEVTLDFNELVNPPCAYTAFATCPLPPPQNKLDVAIEAGEKRYHE